MLIEPVTKRLGLVILVLECVTETREPYARPTVELVRESMLIDDTLTSRDTARPPLTIMEPFVSPVLFVVLVTYTDPVLGVTEPYILEPGAKDMVPSVTYILEYAWVLVAAVVLDNFIMITDDINGSFVCEDPIAIYLERSLLEVPPDVMSFG